MSANLNSEEKERKVEDAISFEKSELLTEGALSAAFERNLKTILANEAFVAQAIDARRIYRGDAEKSRPSFSEFRNWFENGVLKAEHKNDVDSARMSDPSNGDKPTLTRTILSGAMGLKNTDEKFVEAKVISGKRSSKLKKLFKRT